MNATIDAPTLRLELRPLLPPRLDPEFLGRLAHGYGLLFARFNVNGQTEEAERAWKNATFCHQHVAALERGQA